MLAALLGLLAQLCVGQDPVPPNPAPQGQSSQNQSPQNQPSQNQPDQTSRAVICQRSVVFQGRAPKPDQPPTLPRIEGSTEQPLQGARTFPQSGLRLLWTAMRRFLPCSPRSIPVATTRT